MCKPRVGGSIPPLPAILTVSVMWEKTQLEWDNFLSEVRLARANVGATYAGAWFRGQSNDWPLLPSILRNKEQLNREIMNVEKAIKKLEKAHRKASAYVNERGVSEDKVTQEIKIKIERHRTALGRLHGKKPIDGHIPGEGRAFIEYKFRSGTHNQSSWQTLAEMQHYGVPTRLLDWSESFTYALAFALTDFVKELDKKWTNDRFSYDTHPPKLLRYHEIEYFLDAVGLQKKPVIWILNPYKMMGGEKDDGKNVLWDPAINPMDDYYSMFIDKRQDSKPFSDPIPILSPWRDERIAAQQGVFTCYGSRHDDLDKICNSRALRKVNISNEAAVHGVRYLYEFGGLDMFTMFRDKDSLGEKTKKEFLSLDLPTSSEA